MRCARDDSVKPAASSGVRSPAHLEQDEIDSGCRSVANAAILDVENTVPAVHIVSAAHQ